MTIKQYIHNLIYGENFRHYVGEVTDSYVIAPPPKSTVFGVDLSHWNLPPVDIPRMVDMFGMSFVIIKGCDGAVYSKYYFDHVAKAKEAGIPWGSYVWLYPNDKVPVSAQVNAWLARYNVDKPPLGLFIDAEWTYYGGQPANPTAADLRLAHDLWKSRSGERATTYTAAGYANQYLTGFDWSREELWIANYGVSSPALPKGATAWTFWQFTRTLDGKKLDPTGNSELDGNYFVGTEAEFIQRYLGGEVPPDGGIMEQWKIVWDNGCQLRTGPSINNGWAPITPSILPKDAVVNVIARQDNPAGDKWAKHENGYWFATFYGGTDRAVLVPPPVVTRKVTVTVEEDGWKPVSVEVEQEKA